MCDTIGTTSVGGQLIILGSRIQQQINFNLTSGEFLNANYVGRNYLEVGQSWEISYSCAYDVYYLA